jgi:hypothetical protein
MEAEVEEAEAELGIERPEPAAEPAAEGLEAEPAEGTAASE